MSLTTMKLFITMQSQKPILVSAMSLLSMRVLDVIEIAAPLVTQFGQAVIAVLTIIYMIKKIKRNENVK